MSTIRRQGRFAVVPEALIRSTLSDRAVRVWMLLDRYAGANTVAFPSRELLCKAIGASASSLDRAVRDLCESGWLVVERRTPGGVNNYLLTEAPNQAQRLVTPDEGVSSPLTTPLVTPDEEKEASQGTPSEGTPPAPTSRPPRKVSTQLPDDFAVDDGMRKWAVENTPLASVEDELPIFMDYHRGRGQPMKDWRRAWQTWMRRQQKQMAARNAASLARQQARPMGLPGSPEHLQRAAQRIDGAA